MATEITQISLKNKTILLRLDLDMPISEAGQVEDNSRLKAGLKSLKLCLAQASKILILGHLGRPKGVDPKLSLSPVQKELKRLIQQDIMFINSLEGIGDWVKSDSRLGMLENLRFWPGEAQNEPDFVSQLAKYADVFINDAFAVSHRSCASIVGLPGVLPSVIGVDFTQEVAGLQHAFKEAKRPVVMVLGGIKPDKLEFVENFLKFVDNLLVGGRLVDHLPRHPKIIVAQLTPDRLDITPNSTNLFVSKIASAGTVIWNGPVGQFESPLHQIGTLKIAQAIVSSSAHSLIGGGDTLSAIHQFGLKDSQFSHVSLGGGAMLYFLAHKTLPGLEAIDNAKF